MYLFSNIRTKWARHKRPLQPTTPQDSNHLFYVVVRGLVPGIFTEASAALGAVCSVPASHVSSFNTYDEASAYWQRALLAHAVQPVTAAEAPEIDFEHAPLSHGTTKRYLKPSRIASTSLHIRGPARELYIPDLEDGPYNYTKYTKDSDDGEKWVVIRGRKPGIYNSWAAAHGQVHGLQSPQEAYQRIDNLSIARLIFEACAGKGFVEVVSEKQWPDETDLRGCTRCLNYKDRSYNH